MSGGPTAADIHAWAGEIDAVGTRIGRFFARPETRLRAAAYVRGLLADVDRKNGWQLAESLGDATPDGVQYLLARADWSADAVRNDLIGYAHGHLADPGGVLVVDETGFVKKGARSVGVKRQYTGTAGRVENAQVGVFLAFASRHGQALMDRALYLPEEWATDAERRTLAGVPCDVTFATKPALAEQMVRRARRLGVRAAWVTGDTVYGQDGKFRRFLESVGQPYVLAVPCDTRAGTGAKAARVDALADGLGAGEWHRASAGDGSKGPRWYDWAVRAVGEGGEGGKRTWVLIRRHRDRPGERAYYWCWGPAETSWRELVRAAGRRWAVEECFERAKGECGLDEYEVRRWDGWHRHVTLSLFALAVLSVVRIRASRAKGGRS
jgi:SRSO17 transposase